MNTNEKHRPPSPDRAGEFYDAMWKDVGDLDAASPAAFHRIRLVVKYAADAAPDAMTALDVGCGQGMLLRALAARFPRTQICGADVSAQSIADSRRRDPSREFFAIDLCHEDFERAYASRLGKFDLVVCSEVLEHIGDHALAASRLRLLLAPRGVAIVTVPGGKMSRFDVKIGHHRHYTPATLRALLETAGFSVDRVAAWGFPFHNVYRTAVRVASRLAFRDGPARADGAEAGAEVPGVLGRAYALFGAAMKPLFYLNVDRFGEQLIAVARAR